MNKTRFISTEDLKPKRKTKGSAGYDFIAPKDIIVPAGWKVEFDTGVSAEVEEGYVLLLFIRSSLGSKGITLTNNVAVIDSDYRQNIRGFLENKNSDPYTIHKGERYMQGVILPFFTAEDDEVTEERTGGVGSTGL